MAVRDVRKVRKAIHNLRHQCDECTPTTIPRGALLKYHTFADSSTVPSANMTATGLVTGADADGRPGDAVRRMLLLDASSRSSADKNWWPRASCRVLFLCRASIPTTKSSASVAEANAAAMTIGSAYALPLHDLRRQRCATLSQQPVAQPGSYSQWGSNPTAAQVLPLEHTAAPSAQVQ